LAGAVLGYGDILADQRGQCGAASLAKFERGIGIVGQEYLLNAGLRRLPLRDQLDQAVEDSFYAIGQGLLGVHTDAATVHIAPASTFGGNDAVAGNPRAGIDADDDAHVSVSVSDMSIESDSGIQCSHHGITETGVGIDVLHVVQVFQHVDHLHEFFGLLEVSDLGFG